MWKIFLWDSKGIKLQDNIKAVFLWDIKIYPNIIDLFFNIYARWKLKKYWPWDRSNRRFSNYNRGIWTLSYIQSVWDVYWDRHTPWWERGTVEVSNWRLYYPWLKDDWKTNFTFSFWVRLNEQTQWEWQIFSSNAPWDPSWRIFWYSNWKSYYSTYNGFSGFRVIEWHWLDLNKRYFISLAWEKFYINWKLIWSLPSWSIAPWHLYVLWWQSSQWDMPDSSTPHTNINVSDYMIHDRVLSSSEVNWIYDQLKYLYE